MIEFSVDACDPATYAVVRKGLEWDTLVENARRMLSLRNAAQHFQDRRLGGGSVRGRHRCGGEILGRGHRHRLSDQAQIPHLGRQHHARCLALVGPGRLPQHRRGALPLHLRAPEHRLAAATSWCAATTSRPTPAWATSIRRRSATSGTAKASAFIATSTWPGAARTSPCAPAAPIGSTARGSTTTGRSSITPRRRATKKLGRLGEHDDFRGVMDGGTSK